MTGFIENHRSRDVNRAYEIISEYETLIRGLIMSEVKDPVLADDVYQDLFLTLVYRGIPDNVRDLRRYLYAMVRHDIIDAHRRIKRRKSRLQAFETVFTGRAGQDPSAQLARLEQWKRMFAFIEEHVPSQQATALRLRYEAGMDTGEIAEKMGIKPRSVHWYICKGLERLRTEIERHRENSDPSGNNPFVTPEPADT